MAGTGTGSPFTSGSTLPGQGNATGSQFFQPPSGQFNFLPYATTPPSSGGSNGLLDPNVSPFYNNSNPSGDPNYIPSPLNLTPQQQQNYTDQYNAFTNSLALANGGSPSSTTPGQDIYNGLLAQLAQIQPPDQASLQQEAQQEAGLKYDPLIQQLQNNLGSAQTNESAASSKIGDLYSSLGQALAAQMPVVTQQFAAQQNQSQQNYQNLQNQIQSNYQNAQNQQADQLQKLGIQAALPQSEQKLQSDQAYLTSQAATNGNALNQSMQQMGQGQADFMQRASAIAPMQGTNIQAGLAQQLLALQNQTNQQIAGYRGQESAAVATLLDQLSKSATSSYNTQQNDLINQTAKLAQLEKLTSPGVFGVAPKAPSSTYKGLTGIQQYFTDNTQTNDPNELMGDFMSFENSPTLRSLTGAGGAGAPTMEDAWPVLEQIAQQNDPNISNGALQELFNALAIKYGKY